MAQIIDGKAVSRQVRERVANETAKLKEKKENTPIDYTYARPTESEDESVRQAIELARENNLRLHICHLSSSKALEMAKDASKICLFHGNLHLIIY